MIFRSFRPGLTLVELIATLAILAIMGAIAGVAYRRAEPVGASDEAGVLLGAARRQAVYERRPITLTVQLDGRVVDATAFPDGSIVFAGGERWDLLTGGAVDAK